jgi:nitrate reductase alpha subunit
MVEADDRPEDPRLDQSRIGAVLMASASRCSAASRHRDADQNQPVSVAPEQAKVKRGFARDDLFVCVHEQVMTETAAMADIVLPATMFLEHDDIYRGGGHQYIILGPKLVAPPGECRTNHQVIAGLAQRLGFDHPGFRMSEREHIDWMLRKSNRGTLAELEAAKWIDCQPVPGLALSRRLLFRRKIPLQAGLAEGQCPTTG